MFSNLQGRRPMLPQPHQSPLNQTSSHSRCAPSSPESKQVSQLQQQSTFQPRRPRSQIEALPPSQTFQNPRYTRTEMAEFLALQKQMARDPALRHPMFFTDKPVKKAPNGVTVGEGVGRGYIFEERVGGKRDVTL